MDRCRKIFEKQLEIFPEKSNSWISFAEFEIQLQEIERTRSIFELAIQKSNIDMPENIWKAYIDFEI